MAQVSAFVVDLQYKLSSFYKKFAHRICFYARIFFRELFVQPRKFILQINCKSRDFIICLQYKLLWRYREFAQKKVLYNATDTGFYN